MSALSPDPAIPSGSAAAAGDAFASGEGAASRQTDAQDAATLLNQLLPVARLALWEAWDDPLTLIALRFGRTDRPTIPFEPAQLEPNAPWDENVYPGDRAALRTFLDAPDSVRAAKFVDYRLIIAEGELLWVRHWLLHRSSLQEGRRRFRGVLMPIPEQKHLEWECLRVSERECNRIGQELHDDLCQVLAGLAFMTHVLGQRAASVAPVLTSEITELNSQIVGVTDRVRSMAHGLFPARLNYATLRDALHDFVHQTRTRFSVKFDVELPRKLPPHSPEQLIHVYRIVQEAASNAVRHGGAQSLRLHVTTAPRLLRLELADDGTGFPSNAVRPEGIGMHVMHYRARVLGGTIQFKNLTPRGAVVQLSYPTSPSTPTNASSRSRKPHHLT